MHEYDEWLVRLEATYAAVTFCCLHRLGDRTLAERVGVRVVAGLTARPTIFQYTGLPFSGRIGALAERWIVEARAGRLEDRGNWQDLARELAAVPQSERDMLVMACIRGDDDASVADAFSCDLDTARERRRATLHYFGELAARALPGEHALGAIVDAAEAK